MEQVVGRSRECAELSDALRSAASSRVARVIRCSGPAGVGKSHLAASAAQALRANGWVTASTQAHRVQSRLAGIALRRMLGALVASLDEDAARYLGGIEEAVKAVIEGTSDATSVGTTFEKLLHAILLDRPVLLVLDDVMWADEASIASLADTVNALSDHPLAVLFVERSDDSAGPRLPYADTHLAIAPYSVDETRAAARVLLPGASDAAIDAIATMSQGRVADIVAVAASGIPAHELTPEAIGASLRSRIARDVAQLDPALREFLQVCALIGAPIRYGLLRRLFPDERFLLDAIVRTSNTYLVQDADELSFASPSVAQAVRETIAIEIPRRRRIIAAIESIEQKSLEDFERLAQQAADCGDRPAHLAYLMQLADAAERSSALGTAVNALERAVPLMASSPEGHALRGRLCVAYNTLSREQDVLRVIAQIRLEEIPPELAPMRTAFMMQSLFAVWHTSDRAAFERLYDRYVRIAAEDSATLTQLLTIRLFAAVCDYDGATYGALLERLAPALGHPGIAIRVKSFKALMEGRLGNVDVALNELEEALTLAQGPLAPLKTMLDIGNLLLMCYDRGPGSSAVERAIQALPQHVAERVQFEALAALSLGDAREAIRVATEGLVSIQGDYARRQLLAVCAAAAALTGETLPAALLGAIEREARSFVREPGTTSLLGIATAAPLLIATTSPLLARELVEKATDALRRSIEPMTITYPAALVRAAEHLRERKLLATIADGALATDAFAWSKAGAQLAQTLAAHALGRKGEGDAALRETFLNLRAPFFAQLLPQRGIDAPQTKSGPPGRLSLLTKREREVAMLIGDGATNRDIAERLVLSERTIESHVSNIFVKLELTSRAQIAALQARETVTA